MLTNTLNNALDWTNAHMYTEHVERLERVETVPIPTSIAEAVLGGIPPEKEGAVREALGQVVFQPNWLDVSEDLAIGQVGKDLVGVATGLAGGGMAMLGELGLAVDAVLHPEGKELKLGIFALTFTPVMCAGIYLGYKAGETLVDGTNRAIAHLRRSMASRQAQNDVREWLISEGLV